jgi:hypothetical protein
MMLVEAGRLLLVACLSDVFEVVGLEGGFEDAVA